MTETPQTLEFQAETRHLLDLMIHSLYSHKEIFLRELVSNASDALDRLRFESITRKELVEDQAPLEIRLEVDREQRTLAVHDNGIGMSREELVRNLGTIARSGTRELLEQLRGREHAAPPELIGQFGVGFYSSFMVADRVTVVTRRAGESGATKWESAGDGKFTVTEAERPARGTTVTLHLVPVDAESGIEDFTSEWTLSRIVKKYSDFITYPVRMKVPRDAAGKEGEVEERTLNSMKAIWSRRESEVKPEEYDEFYRHIGHEWEGKPLRVITQRAEGALEYEALLFVPEKAPHEPYYQGHPSGLALYVRRVKIMDVCEDLLPRYLRFLRGVVDSPDVPLNVSRETLQHNRQIGQIRRNLTKKVLDTLAELKEKEGEKYVAFWSEHGRAIKEGAATDFDNRDKLEALLLFESSHDPVKLTSLADYLARMKPEQTEIYYLTGESRAQVERSPHLEALRERGYEVLLMTDPVDELLVQQLTEVAGKRLKSIGKGEVELGSEEERAKARQATEEKQKQMASLLELVQKRLDAHVKEVRLTSRLTSSPACLVVGEHDYSPQLEKLLQRSREGGPRLRRILELNPGHALVQKLQERFERDHDDPELGDHAELLYAQALLAEGGEVPDPVKLAQQLADLMTRSL